ncbi:hypothetical protein JM654_20730 [Microbacterium oxydans]|nr:hypothetical protein [Microbacterium oxydans]
MNTPVDALSQVVADLDAVLRSEAVVGLSDASKMELLRMAGEAQRRVEAVVVEVVASVESRPAGSGDLAFCGLFGCRTVGELLQRVLRVDATGATRVVKAARAVRREVDLTSGGWLPSRWPALRASLLDGTVGGRRGSRGDRSDRTGRRQGGDGGQVAGRCGVGGVCARASGRRAARG